MTEAKDGSKLVRMTYEELVESVGEKPALVELMMIAADGGDGQAQNWLLELWGREPVLWDALRRHHGKRLDQRWEKVASGSWIAQQVLHERAETMREGLLGGNASPLERLIADDVVTCWISLQFAEAVYLASTKRATPHANIKLFIEQLDRSHRRFLNACRTLAQIRRLQLPPISQLNLGQNQVNIAPVNEERAELPDLGAALLEEIHPAAPSAGNEGDD